MPCESLGLVAPLCVLASPSAKGRDDFHVWKVI